MRIKKIIISLLIITVVIVSQPLVGLAGKGDVVSLGADLSSQQQGEMLKEFGVNEDEVNIIKVSIQDVKNHLDGVSSKDIGTKAISSAYVKLLPE